MKISFRSLWAALMMLSLSATAEIPTGYYSSLTGKSEAQLKTAVYTLVKNFTSVSSYQALPQYFQQTDVYPDSRRWWEMYSNMTFYIPSFSGMNREHSFPKSWWGGDTDVKAYTDLNHLYPSEARANQAKSNYPLGEVDRSRSVKFENGVTTVGYPINGQGGGAQYVFEPADEYKGDFARTYFYMVTCYQDYRWNTTYMLSQNTYPTLNQWSVNLLLKWHRQDPVSDKETARNEVVYSYQNNRNPFIDYPELAEYIWGNRKGEAFVPGQGGGPVGTPTLINPNANTTADFNQVALGESIQKAIFFKGENMTSDVKLQIYRGDTDMFSLSTNSIAANLMNTEEGYWLYITYKPTSLGKHEARLLISGGGMTATRGVGLMGECLPVPELTACTATEATDITSDSYVANWISPADEVVDYWVVNRTKYINGSPVTEQLVSEETSLQIDGFDKSDSESYTVQSVRLGHYSPESNVIYVAHDGVTGVTMEQPLAVMTFSGALRFLCSEPQEDCRIYDISGRLYRYVGHIDHCMDIDIEPGVYLITTATHHTPVKVIVK